MSKSIEVYLIKKNGYKILLHSRAHAAKFLNITPCTLRAGRNKSISYGKYQVREIGDDTPWLDKQIKLSNARAIAVINNETQEKTVFKTIVDAAKTCGVSVRTIQSRLADGKSRKGFLFVDCNY